MLKVNLREIIDNNWNKNEFISLSLNKDLVKIIKEETQFLDSSYNKIPLRTRAYVILNELSQDTIPKCVCGRPAAINSSYTEKGFRIYCGPECSRKNKTIDKSIIEKLDNYEFLYDEKIVKQKSIEQIAEEVGVSITPVVKYLKKHKLYQLNDARRVAPKISKMLNDKDLMYEYYINQNKTLREISKTIGCGTALVINSLRNHNINIKKPNFYERTVKCTSKEENELYEFIKGLENGKVEQGNRKICNGKEIDIFIPNKSVAFEYNGIYSHLYRPNETTTSRIKDKTYHLNKTLKAKMSGINLYHIFSSDWNSNKIKIKNFVKRKLHLNEVIKLTNNYKINVIELKDLVTLNLIYNNNIISKLVCKNNKNYLSIIKYTVKANITLKGGFNILLKFLTNSYKMPIYCKINRRFSEGRLLTSYGFKVSSILEPKMLYTDNSYDLLYEDKIKNKKMYGIYDCGYLILKYQ